ncbi:MAG: HAD family hydrolase [Candidatus Thorarchaeota archaeon]|jgi:phosphoserine phosphatase
MSIKLVVFDVDGTLTKHSSIWWRIHQLFETTAEGKLYYDQYFAGEISYDQWADYDAALWKDKPVETVMETVRNATLVPGAIETIKSLNEHKIETAVLSGGLDIMADDIARRLGIDYVLTNKLHHKNGLLTGTVDNLVAWSGKAKEIGKINDHFDVRLDDTAFVGDGLNDVSVFAVVGLSIAFNPEHQDVADAADVVVHEEDLRSILPHVISGFQQ